MKNVMKKNKIWKRKSLKYFTGLLIILILGDG